MFEIENGPRKAPKRIFLYGPGGIGKTTWAANAPNPIFLDLDMGSFALNVPRNKKPILTWQELLTSVKEVATEKHSFETLVVDTADRAEALAITHVCKTNRKGDYIHPVENLEQVGGGWNKGANALVEEKRKFWNQIEQCYFRGMNIIVISHEKLGKVKNPSGYDYDKYVPKLNDRVWGMYREVVDVMMFVNYDIVLKKGHIT